MTELPPSPPNPGNTDPDHVNLLAIFHFIGAGLALLGIGFLFMHYTFLHAVLDNPKMWENNKNVPPPAEFFAIFKWFYLVGAIWFLASCALNVISGFCLRAKKHRTFSLVVAGINCVHMPFGTVLGVFTIVVLQRDSVCRQYDAAAVHPVN